MRNTWTAASLADRLNHLRRYRRDSTDFVIIEPGQPVGLMMETICAFANMPHGGTLVFGISKEYGYRVVGVKNIGALVEHITKKVRRMITPSPFLDFHPLEFANTHVVIVQVRSLPASLPIARCAGLAYLRHGEQNYFPSPHEQHLLEDYKRDAKVVSPEKTEIPFTSVQDLRPLAVALFVDKLRRDDPQLAALTDDRQVLSAVEVFGAGGSLSLAGAYLLGAYPQAMYPQLKISAVTEFTQSDGSISSQRREFDGSLPEMLEQALAWVKRNSRPSAYPITAVREFIVNALVHRDLVSLRPVELKLCDDRLIISNPGGLRGVSFAELKSPQAHSNPINPVIFQLAQRLAEPVVTGQGLGVKNALWALRDAQLVPPSVIDTGTEVSVVIYNVSAFTQAELDWLVRYGKEQQLGIIEQGVLIGLRRGETWNTSKLLAEYPGYTYRQISRMVDKLADARLIVVGEDGDFQLATKPRKPAALA